MQKLTEEQMKAAYSHAHYRLFRPPFEWPSDQEMGLVCSALINGGDYLPQRFFLNRHEDVSGVSGTGRIAEGVIFKGGKVVLFWYSSQSIAIYDSLDVLKQIHGHGGKTAVELIA